MEKPDYIDQLATELGTKWPSILEARRRTRDERKKLEALLDSDSQRFASEDTSIVVFGSLARGEWASQKSDVDWTFLIDGQAEPEHLDISLEIRAKLDAEKYVKPGKTGTFGNMSFSHDLIHRIGGEYDTNSNITKRILLLLESQVIGKTSEAAHRRVVSQILARYLSEERQLIDSDRRYRVPRFLLNDVVRFWRTMAVDFASKQRERQGKQWGLRSAKLRFSRKLIFVSGLLMCFSHRDAAPPASSSMEGENQAHFPFLSHILEEYVSLSPLEILARDFIRYKRLDFASKVFEGYDKFLAILENKSQREELERLSVEDADSSLLFRKVRDDGREFGNGLEDFFFKTPKLCNYIKKYGVF